MVLSRCGGGSQLSVPPLTITPASLPNGTLGAPYSQTIQAGGEVAPFNWLVTGALTHNLQLVPGAGKTATISGTPDTAAQGVEFTIKVTGNRIGLSGRLIRRMPDDNRSISFPVCEILGLWLTVVGGRLVAPAFCRLQIHQLPLFPPA